ncbi:type II secretion system protein [Vibrio astriarenae]
MKKQGGFTLIELVVVIVILGILAVTAAPKFLNLQEDARKSSLQGLKGAMDGAAGIVYGKAAIEGKERSSAADEEVDGIDIIYGYPKASDTGIALAVTGLSEDWVSAVDTTQSAAAYVTTFKSDSVSGATQIINTKCFVRYTEATSTAVDSIAKASVIDDEC